jgi:hypothetical protein
MKTEAADLLSQIFRRLRRTLKKYENDTKSKIIVILLV